MLNCVIVYYVMHRSCYNFPIGHEFVKILLSILLSSKCPQTPQKGIKFLKYYHCHHFVNKMVKKIKQIRYTIIHYDIL